MKVVIGTDHVGTQYIEDLKDVFPDVEFVAAYDPAEHVEAVRDADVFFGWPDGPTVAAGSALRWIACPGMGIDKIVAYESTVESDVPITNAPGTHVTSMADHTLGAMIALAHRFQQASEDRRKKVWKTGEYAHNIVELTGKTLGIHGLGAIGRAVAKRAAAFDMTIFAVDPGPLEVPDSVRECWDTDRIDDLCRVSNFLVIASPLIDETRNVFDARRLALMPEGSYVVIMSRGEIVNEDDLCDAIESGHIAGAAVDATAVEPLPQDSRLWTLEEVILTPHSSALTPELYEMRREVFRQNLRRFVNGESLLHVCDKRRGW